MRLAVSSYMGLSSILVGHEREVTHPTLSVILSPTPLPFLSFFTIQAAMEDQTREIDQILNIETVPRWNAPDGCL